MDFLALCEIAERELNGGLADEKLWARSLAEAKGVEVHARQIFWHLRAKQLQEAGDEAVKNLVSEIETQEARLRSRKESHRWIWALACVAGMLGATLFPIYAFRAVGKPGPAFLMFFTLSAASLALAAYALVASKYHTHTD